MPPKHLLDKLSYNPETGEFTRQFKFGVMKPAGKLNDHGYVKISIDRKEVSAHRLAWFFHYGEWPKGEIDHINQNKADNRIVNLRDVSKGENKLNSKVYKNNTSGFTGVYWIEHCLKWQAKISFDGKELNLGLFENKDDAIKARKEAEIACGVPNAQ